MIAEVAIRSRSSGDVADMTFSFVAHVRCTQRRCIDAPDPKVNLLYEGVLDTSKLNVDECVRISFSSRAHSSLGSTATTIGQGVIEFPNVRHQVAIITLKIRSSAR